MDNVIRTVSPTVFRDDVVLPSCSLILAEYQLGHNPVNTKHLYNICTMLDQRRRRWADVVQMLYKCFASAGKVINITGVIVFTNWCVHPVNRFNPNYMYNNVYNLSR